VSYLVALDLSSAGDGFEGFDKLACRGCRANILTVSYFDIIMHEARLGLPEEPIDCTAFFYTPQSGS